MKHIWLVVSMIILMVMTGCSDAGKDQKVYEGDTVTLDGSASQGKYGFTILKYKWRQIRGKQVNLVDKNRPTTTFVAPSLGKRKKANLVFELITTEKMYWGPVIHFRDRVRIRVEKSNNSDVTPPTITLNGDANVTLFVDDTYTEMGATATDAVDGNVSVTIDGTVDTSKAGTYTVTYSAQDNAGNEASITRTVIVQAPILTSLQLESNTSTLNVGEQVSFTLMGTYSDQSTKEVDANITWIMNPTENLEVNGTAFVATKDGNVTVQAKVNDVLSNVLALNIVWVINGYQLPPEPDPTVNNATLLGVDSNGNGVRDDVERKIIVKYKKPIEIELLMSYARVDQETLEKPLSEALVLERKASRVGDCRMYLKHQGIIVKSGIRDSENLTYNTKQRAKKYMEYNKALSGGVYGSSPADWNANACDFDAEQMLKDRK